MAWHYFSKLNIVSKHLFIVQNDKEDLETEVVVQLAVLIRLEKRAKAKEGGKTEWQSQYYKLMQKTDWLNNTDKCFQI